MISGNQSVGLDENEWKQMSVSFQLMRLMFEDDSGSASCKIISKSL